MPFRKGPDKFATRLELSGKAFANSGAVRCIETFPMVCMPQNDILVYLDMRACVMQAGASSRYTDTIQVSEEKNELKGSFQDFYFF